MSVGPEMKKNTAHNLVNQVFHTTRVFVWVGPWAFCQKIKIKCPKEPHPNLPNLLRFYDQIGRRLFVFLSNCSGTL
jgi:hypothetical protein